MEKGNGTRLVIRKKTTGSGMGIAFSGEMTIYTVGKLRDPLLGYIGQGKSLALDFSGIHKIDTAGYQLLVTLKRECAKRKIGFEITESGKEVGGILALFGGTL